MEKIFYLAQVIGGLQTMFGIILGICMAVAIFVTIGAIVMAQDHDNPEENHGFSTKEARDAYVEESLLTYKALKKWATILWTVVFISACVKIFVPNKQTFLFMVGGAVVDNAIEHKPEIKELPENTLNLLNEYIKEATDDVRLKRNTEGDKK